MLLTKLEITNFLSINGTLPIDLDRNVTILLGSNDHGKSNILRAIEHLNYKDPITEDEANWDAKGGPAISFVFSLTATERDEWGTLVDELIHETMEATATSDGASEVAIQAEPAKTSDVTRVFPAGWRPMSGAVESMEERVSEQGPEFYLDPRPATLTLSRKGVGAGLEFGGVALNKLPKTIENFFNAKKPRVELFKALAGNLQDAAAASTINTDEFEFLQGVFFYAGLEPSQTSPLFIQDDKTIRALDNASKQLDKNLRNLWGQGTDLHFELRHKGTEILFLADDPAIKSRKARMSKRSAGVTQFFRVSMVLYARRKKHPANSYIYLFDEPGVLLHPQGQRDLLQVFEELGDENQIVYATHSLFLLNQNFPERHRLIFKDEEGTKVDQKPYRQNWKLATDALGVYLTSNILFSNRVLLVEGDSDPMYLYEMLRQLNKSKDLDADLNTLGIMSFYDYQNLRFLLQVFKREGQDVSLCVLVDGDSEGKAILQKVSNLCKKLNVPAMRLGENRSIEDYCLFEDEFIRAAIKTLQNACESEGKPVPKDLEERVRKSWADHKAAADKPDRKLKAEKGERDEKEERRTAGRWFKSCSKEIIDDEASKVVLARNYSELCRETKELPTRERIKEAKPICQEIADNLALPSVRAVKTIEVPH